MTRPRDTAAAATALVAAAALLLLGPAQAAEAPDTTAPTGAVAGAGSPARGTLELRLYASDSGWGLATAEASLDNKKTSIRLGQGSCPENPSPVSPEPSPGDCPASVSGVPLELDTTALPDGPHDLRVRVTDAAGNTATLVDRQIAVRNAPVITSNKATATIGVAGGEEGGKGPGKGKGCEKGKACDRGKGGEKGKGLALKRRRCRAPHLAMRLAKRPLWHTRPRHVPVLWYGHRYPYRGKLTCRSAKGKRFLAPRGTPVTIYFRVWQLSFKRYRGPVRFRRVRTIRVGRKGRINTKLGFKSGRTVMFRYYGPRKELAKAKLRLAVPPRTRRPPWGVR